MTQQTDALFQQIAQAVHAQDKEGLEDLCFHFLDQEEAGERAEKVAQLLVRVAPNNADAYNVLGMVLFNNDKFPEIAYEKALQIDPKHGMACSNYANVLQKLGLLPEALEYFYKALQYLETIYHPSVYVNMANVYLWQADFEKARECADKAYDLNPNDALVNSLLGNIYVALNDDEKAEKYYVQSLQSKERSVVLCNLARVYERQEKYDLALKTNKKAIQRIQKTYNTDIVSKLPDNLDIRQPFYMDQAYHNKAEANQVLLQNDSLDTTGWDNIVKNIPLKSKKTQILHIKNFNCLANDWQIFDQSKIFYNLVFYTVTWANKNILYNTQTGHSLLRTPEQKKTIESPVVLMGGAPNYYHWICDYLPRVRFLEAIDEIKDLPVLINTDFTDYQKASLEAVGVDIGRFQPVENKTLYHIKEAYLIHQLGRPLESNNAPDWMKPALDRPEVDWLRSAYAPYMKSKKENPKRLFMSRRNAKFRICLNEDEVYDIAKEYGFEKVHNEDMSFTDQIALYAGVEAVLGVHGAGFTNMVFSPNDATLIELHSRNELPEFYVNIANILGQKHIGIEGVVTRALPPLAPPFWNFEIDTKKVRAVLDREFGKT